VLIGFICVEFFTLRVSDPLYLHKRLMLSVLFSATILAMIWFVAEFFADMHLLWNHVFFHVPFVVAIAMLLLLLTHMSKNRTIRILFTVFLFSLVVGLIIDMWYVFNPLPVVSLLRVLLKTVEVCVFYFYITLYVRNHI